MHNDLKKKILVGITSLSLVAATLTGGFPSVITKADTTALSTKEENGHVWSGYFGASEGWYEGAEGQLVSSTDDSWTAELASVGWGGIWSAQVYIDNNQSDSNNRINVKKGKKYHLSFSMKSTTVTKFVYIKLQTTYDKTAYCKWVKLPAGKTTNFDEEFIAEDDATAIYFGMGGDFGDRADIDSDSDAVQRYELFEQQYGIPASIGLAEDADGDSTFSTTIFCNNFSLEEVVENTTGATTSNQEQTLTNSTTSQPSTENIKIGKASIKSVKNAKGKKAIIKLTAIKNISGYQLQYSTNKKFTKAKSKYISKSGYTVKNLKKKKKYFFRARAFKTVSGKMQYGEWSNVKKLKITK